MSTLTGIKQCFYSVGFIGIIFTVDVSTADTSRLKDRGLAYAFTASPWIITAYAGPAISQRFYEYNWRWAFGCFAIILPVVGVPFFVLMQWHKRKAEKLGKLVKEKSDKTWTQLTMHYLIEFDGELVGIISSYLTSC